MEENNKMDISRRGFLKTAALAGAAMAMPSGLGKVFASEAKQTETSDVDTDAAISRDIVYWVRVRLPSRCQHSASA